MRRAVRMSCAQRARQGRRGEEAAFLLVTCLAETVAAAHTNVSRVERAPKPVSTASWAGAAPREPSEQQRRQQREQQSATALSAH